MKTRKLLCGQCGEHIPPKEQARMDFGKMVRDARVGASIDIREGAKAAKVTSVRLGEIERATGAPVTNVERARLMVAFKFSATSKPRMKIGDRIRTGITCPQCKTEIVVTVHEVDNPMRNGERLDVPGFVWQCEGQCLYSPERGKRLNAELCDVMERKAKEGDDG